MSVYDLHTERQRKRLASSGWNLGAAGSDFPGPALYVVDYVTGYMQLGQVHSTRLCEIHEQQPYGQGRQLELLTSHLSALLDETRGGAASPEQQDRILEHLAQYLAHTRTFATALATGALDEMALVVLRYPDASNNDEPILRPYAVSVPEEAGVSPLLSPVELQRDATQILEVDKQLHPERFNPGQVLPFPGERRR